MTIEGWVSAIFIGLLIGILGRLLVRSREPAGCIVTVITGIVAAFAGAWIGTNAGWSFWPTFLLQIVLAAVITALISIPSAMRRRD